MHGVEVGMSSRTILLSCLLLITTTATTAYPLRLSGFLPHHMPRGSALFFFFIFFSFLVLMVLLWLMVVGG